MRLEADKECLVCDYCRNVYFPAPNEDGVRNLEEASDLRCPVCAIPLVHASVVGHKILYCARCRGSLTPMSDFVAIVQGLRSRRERTEESSQQPDWRALERHIRCPRCSHPMDAHSYCGGGNVIIDTCENCALNWLDATELGRIVRAPHQEFVRPVVVDYTFNVRQ